jgi:hypothetical protein
MQGQSVLEQRAFSPRTGQTSHTDLQPSAGFGLCGGTAEDKAFRQSALVGL